MALVVVLETPTPPGREEPVQQTKGSLVVIGLVQAVRVVLAVVVRPPRVLVLLVALVVLVLHHQ